MDNQNIVQQNNTDTSLLDRLKLIDHIVGIATALNTECTNLQLEAESEHCHQKFCHVEIASLSKHYRH